MNVLSSIEAAPRGGVAPCSKRVMNLSHFLRQAGRRHGDEIGFVHGEQHLTWAQLDARVDAMALALTARGVVKGDRILVQSRNCNQLFESMFACFRIGAVWVPTNYRQSPAEVAYLAEASGASVMICQDVFPAHAQAVQEAVGGLEHLITIGEGRETYDALVAEHAGQPCALMDLSLIHI